MIVALDPTRAAVGERTATVLDRVDIDQLLLDRFWSKVSVGSTCWIWTAYRDRHGYGRFSVGGRQGGMLQAHDVSFWIHHKRPPSLGMHLDHLCRNRGCVRPDHLEEVTPSENAKRGIAGEVNAQRQRSITHCPQGHPYDSENTSYHSGGRRRCKACMRAGAKARRRAKKGAK